MGSMKTPMGKKVVGQKYKFFIDPANFRLHFFHL